MLLEESIYYILNRYRYDVTYTSLVDSWALAAVTSMVRMF